MRLNRANATSAHSTFFHRGDFALAPGLYSYARLGDADWMRTFREFIDAFNDFVVGLGHNRLNLAAGKRMRTTGKGWRPLSPPQHCRGQSAKRAHEQSPQSDDSTRKRSILVYFG